MKVNELIKNLQEAMHGCNVPVLICDTDADQQQATPIDDVQYVAELGAVVVFTRGEL